MIIWNQGDPVVKLKTFYSKSDPGSSFYRAKKC